VNLAVLAKAFERVARPCRSSVGEKAIDCEIMPGEAYDVNDTIGPAVAGQDSDTVADLQSKLRDVQAELDRASMQRDYALHLLRQQQSMGTSYVQNRAMVSYLAQYSILARLARRVPRRLRSAIPLPVKQALMKLMVMIE